MSKGAKEHAGSEKPKQVEGEHKKPGGDAKAGEAKHPETKHGDAKHADAPRSSKAKGHNPMPGGCHCWGCKAQATRLDFCAEHFDHFKFGLIKKTGEPVSDYEKKFEHFMAHKAKKGVQRVA